MADGSIDSSVLAALYLMSQDKLEGVRYLEFVKLDIMNAALDLTDRGYARKIHTGVDDANYCLTPAGIEYMEKILAFAQAEF